MPEEINFTEYGINDAEIPDASSIPSNTIDFTQLSGDRNEFLRKTKGLATRAAQSPFDIASFLTGLVSSVEGEEGIFGKASEELKSASEGIESFAGKEQVAPQSKVEEAAQMTARNIPFLVGGGAGATALKGLSDFAGSLAMIGAKDMGAGPIGELAAGIGGSFAFDKGLKKILNSEGLSKVVPIFKKFEKEPSKLTEFRTQLYNKEKELGSKIPAADTKVGERLSEVYDSISNNPKLYSEVLKERLQKTIPFLENNKNLKASELFKEKQLFNEIYDKAPLSGKELSTRKNISRIFGDSLDEIGSSHKEWGTAYKQADQLTTLQNWKPSLANVLSSYGGDKIGKIANNPLTKSVLYALAGVGGFGLKSLWLGLGIPALDIAGKTGSSVVKGGAILANLSSTSEGRRFINELIVSGAKKDGPMILNAINKIDKYISKNFPNDSKSEDITFEEYGITTS